jgi:hypothetical protein
MLAQSFPRSAYLTQTGNRRKNPRYTLGDLFSDIEQHASDCLYFWDGHRCPKFPVDVVVEVLRTRMKLYNPERGSPFLLFVPRKGIAVLTRNPWLKRPRGRRPHEGRSDS